ncbi:MAG: HNH endonuclease [Candidatus Gottesmanbacteria bacterium GW2011_GWB1_49_7]|uniref:HNH endonuclease n=1 Tax=Candidatus Gottesmanbacteria bacterium GW2011_GWB1_49_7 TaxID=1618448 RepID=A0A0G1W438_9BACT|nr:MAG: HNH endonuclease [Candidatus Gottesmanbacteria bacterium GW2011_GWB1_49_7]
MSNVLVMDTNKQPLRPCHPAVARILLKHGKAAVYRQFPFTIILKYEVTGPVEPLRLKIDPGSKTTGMAIVDDATGEVVWAAEIEHRGQRIRDRLLARRQLRRGRRNRKTRYRKPRFDNRRRREGWLPPSLESRVANVETWVNRLRRWCALGNLSYELVRFDTQQLQNPEVNGVEYQQGELLGYEVREYLLEKWQRQCAYCGVENVPLEVEHIVPKSRGGSNRVSNLTLACVPCNGKKGNQTAAEFGFPEIQAQAKHPLKDATVVNATRWALYRRLAALGLDIEVGTGGRTKFNRTRQGLPKAHWLDAACVGASTPELQLNGTSPWAVKAKGWGQRQMCRMDRYGFPRTGAKQAHRVHGFATGDLVQAVVPTGKKQGVHVGRVAIRTQGTFRVGVVDGINWRYCTRRQAGDGYDYTKEGARLPPTLERRGFPSREFL